MTRDIHKIDNHLIRFGWLALAVGLLSTACSSQPFDSLRVFWSCWVPLAASALMLPLGYFIRAKESRVIILWDILDTVTDVSLVELERSTGFKRHSVLEMLAVINAQPGAYYVHDLETDQIIDGRLRTEVIHVDTCANCGAPINERVSLALATSPACAHCGGPILDKRFNELKLSTLAKIRSRRPSRHRFSLVIFVILLIVFWPAGVAYAIWKSGLVDGWLARVRAA